MTALRIAVRKFGPFESAIEKQFRDFVETSGVDATLEAIALDLNPLHETLIGSRGLARGDWDPAPRAVEIIMRVGCGGQAHCADLRKEMRSKALPFNLHTVGRIRPLHGFPRAIRARPWSNFTACAHLRCSLVSRRCPS